MQRAFFQGVLGKLMDLMEEGGLFSREAPEQVGVHDVSICLRKACWQSNLQSLRTVKLT